MDRFYKKNTQERLSKELFENPTAEYRGAPFWAWNGALDGRVLEEQIDVMKEMGMGGFHIHVRTGLDTPYLGREYMNHVKACVEKAQKEDMLAWLYDEDRWPSGAAGGKVTRGHPAYAAKSLLFTVTPYETGKEGAGKKEEVSAPGRGRGGVRMENGRLLAVYDVRLGEDGTLEEYRRIEPGEQAFGTKWYAYLEHGEADPWFNNGAYLDTLNPQAVDQFINITHRAYKEALGEKFGERVPAIFTDEPQFTAKSILNLPQEKKDVFLPWTEGFSEGYREKYGEEPLETLPELIWELPEGRRSQARYRYHDFVAELFVENYCGRIGEWCRENGIRFTGHVMGEGSLEEQTMTLGECMRCYGAFSIPGMDNLCDRREYTTAKQTQSAVHQQGAEGMLSELYGVTGWDYDFRGYKLQGDWQAALGVTVRVPHLFWMTMKGEAKRDFPASIGCQSPWYQQFSLIENYFARLNTALTRGKPRVRIAVIHPIESYWLHWGPSMQTAAVREHLEESFQRLTEYLLFSLLDFDFISESTLPKLCPQGGAPLQVGAMSYEAVIVCGCETLRSTTLERLEAFFCQGGDLIFVGACPRYIDAVFSDRVQTLYAKAKKAALSPASLWEALGKYAFVRIQRQDGKRCDFLLSQQREDKEGQWLFLANGKKPECPDVEEETRLHISLAGAYDVRCYDPMTGEIFPLEAELLQGETCWEQDWHMHDSMLLHLTPAKEENKNRMSKEPQDIKTQKQQAEAAKEAARTALPEGCIQARAALGTVCFGPVKTALSEPNMCLLDIGEFAVDQGPWMPEEEILRIDNIARSRCGLPLRRREVVQPYLLPKEKPTHSIRVRFLFESEIELSRLKLGLEDASATKICWNGQEVSAPADGWYVDRAIETVSLPGLKKGTNRLEVTVPLGQRTNLEAMYLLGDFGVRLAGSRKILTALPGAIGFGDITCQGLPFYTGNLEYSFEIEVSKEEALGETVICVPRYRGGLIKVFADGKERGDIIFSPYRLGLGHLGEGRHKIMLRLYGTRQNGFAQLHHTPGVWFYQGPNSWRSSGALWCYEYQLRQAGILSSPRLENASFVSGEFTDR